MFPKLRRYGYISAVLAVVFASARAEEKDVAQSNRQSPTRPGAVAEIAGAEYLWVLDKPEKDLEERYRVMLETLRRSKVPTERAAERLVSDARDAALAAHDLEGMRVDGLVKIGRDMPGYAARGDMVWIVVCDDGSWIGKGGVVQVGWVNSANGLIRWIFPQTAFAKRQ